MTQQTANVGGDPGGHQKAWHILHEFLSPEQCVRERTRLREQYKDGIHDAGVGGGSGAGTVNKTVRITKIAWVQPSDDLVMKMLGAAEKVNQYHFGMEFQQEDPNAQFTIYPAVPKDAPDVDRSKYTAHIDTHLASAARYVEGSNPPMVYPVRKLSMVLLLTDPKKVKGGELKLHHCGFNPGQACGTGDQCRNGSCASTYPKIGDLIMFPSYVLHEVTPLEQGSPERISLVAWKNGAPFK